MKQKNSSKNINHNFQPMMNLTKEGQQMVAMTSREFFQKRKVE